MFVHLLPESYSNPSQSGNSNGLWLIFGLLTFLTIEKIFPDDEKENENKIDQDEILENIKRLRKNGPKSVKKTRNYKLAVLHSIKVYFVILIRTQY